MDNNYSKINMKKIESLLQKERVCYKKYRDFDTKNINSVFLKNIALHSF